MRVHRVYRMTSIKDGRVRLVIWLLPLSLLASVGGCGSSRTVIHEGPTGSVYLEELSAGALEAAHPVSLGRATLARVMVGMQVKDDTRLLQSLMPNKPKTEAVFSPDEAEFLAPLLDAALMQASPREMIRFLVYRFPASGREATGGALYVKNLSLYVTLTQYRVRPSKAHSAIKFDRRTRESTGLDQRRVSFVPKGVERADLDPQSGLVGPSTVKTLVLDYQLLNKLAGLEAAPPAAALQPERVPPSENVTSLEEQVHQQEQEIEGLKEELRSLRNQIGVPSETLEERK